MLAIETRNNGQESITAQQVGLSYASDGSIKKLMRDQDRFIWFLAFNQEQIYTVSSAIQYDEQEMQAAISGLKCMQTGQDPVDAHIDEQNDKFVIIPEEEGNALDPEKLPRQSFRHLLQGRPPWIWKQKAAIKNRQYARMTKC